MSVRVARGIAVDLLEEARWRAPKETGGILLGYWDGDCCSVTAQVGPGPRSKHTLHSFVPDYHFQENEVARLYVESGRILEYLGDWHTHPDTSLYLSSRDRETMDTIAAYSPARCPRPVMVILGGRDEWGAAAWVGEVSESKKRSKIRTAKVEFL